MHCTQCGATLTQKDAFCGSCGAATTVVPPPPPPGAPAGPSSFQHAGTAAPASNALSNVAMIFGILSFFFFPIVFGPIGLVLGAVAKSKGEPKAKTAITVSAVGLVLGMIIGAVVFSSM